MRMRCPKRLGSQVPGLTAANSPAKFFERRTATPEEFVPPVVEVLGVLFEISIVCFVFVCFVGLVFAGCVLGMLFVGVFGVCLACFVCLGGAGSWGACVFPGFVVLPG